MAVATISIDRRQHSREGIIGQLEDITYAVVRRYSVMGEVGNNHADPRVLPPAIH